MSEWAGQLDRPPGPHSLPHTRTPLLPQKPSELPAVRNAVYQKQLGDISFNCPAGYAHIIRNFRVAKSPAKQTKYVPLTLGQPLQRVVSHSFSFKRILSSWSKNAHRARGSIDLCLGQPKQTYHPQPAAVHALS